MGHLLDALRSIATAAKSFLRAPTTVQFPKEVRPRPERYRASFALLHEDNGDEACIGCLQCERICPSKVISIKGPAKRDSAITGKKRSYADDFTLDLSACIFCELCVQVCPTDAIVMTKEPEPPAFSREELVLTMPKLYANEKSKTRAWGDGTKLNAMQAIPKPPPAPPLPAGERVGERAVPAASPASESVTRPAAAAPPAAPTSAEPIPAAVTRAAALAEAALAAAVAPAARTVPEPAPSDSPLSPTVGAKS